MKTDILLKRINLLPENLQFQVLDYVDFLINRYSEIAGENLEVTEKEEISPELKALLDIRIANYNKNPHKVKTWEEIETRLLAKNKHVI